jgi:hypothetical protein
MPMIDGPNSPERASGLPALTRAFALVFAEASGAM